jgi:hypothetical protein
MGDGPQSLAAHQGWLVHKRRAEAALQSYKVTKLQRYIKILSGDEPRCYPLAALPGQLMVYGRRMPDHGPLRAY